MIQYIWASIKKNLRQRNWTDKYSCKRYSSIIIVMYLVAKKKTYYSCVYGVCYFKSKVNEQRRSAERINQKKTVEFRPKGAASSTQGHSINGSTKRRLKYLKLVTCHRSHHVMTSLHCVTSPHLASRTRASGKFFCAVHFTFIDVRRS